MFCSIEKRVKAVTMVDLRVYFSDAGRLSRIHMLVVVTNHYGDHMVLLANH